jgi:uncharacterized protein YjhX (UPF0386 family)
MWARNPLIRCRFQPQLLSSNLEVVAKGGVIKKLTFGKKRVTRIKCNTWKYTHVFDFGISLYLSVTIKEKYFALGI